MWLKRLFSIKSSQQKQPEMNQSFSFQQLQQSEQTYQQTSTLIDLLPDLRYEQIHINNEQIKNIKLPFPSTLLDQHQTIVYCKIDPTDGFMIKTSYNDFITCKIVITDKQLIFTPNIFAQKKSSKSLNNLYLSIPLGQIEKVQFKDVKKQPAKLILTLKDSRQLIVKNKIVDFLKHLQQKIIKFGHVTGINRFYAFQYRKRYIKNQQIIEKGWRIYDIKKQIIRQGAQKFIIMNQSNKSDPPYAFKIIKNSNFQISPTYPIEFFVPFNITTEQLIKSSKFRTRQRIPALSYFYEYKSSCYSSLFRCSQIKTGVMGNRCQQDQKIIKKIAECMSLISKNKKSGNNNQIIMKHNLKIYDARGYYAALGNMLVGKGYEKQQTYNCEVTFLNIPNIHAVRQSYQKVKSFNPENQDQDFYGCLSSSGWMQYVFLILSGSKEIALDLIKGKNVLVHCSDGWDRTSQLSSLSQMLLDPYYRTLEGLAVLIEKDWRHFGHKFRDRTGQYRTINYRLQQKSPVFIQFLDCIYQIQSQFPLTFEYNHKLLQFLAEHVNSCIYGTFLSNNMKQATQLKLQNETISIWTDILYCQRKQYFLNPLYKSQMNIGFLNVSLQMKNMQIWRQHLLQQNNKSHVVQFSLKKQSEINKTLRNQYYANQKLIQELKKQLKQL